MMISTSYTHGSSYIAHVKGMNNLLRQRALQSSHLSADWPLLHIVLLDVVSNTTVKPELTRQMSTSMQRGYTITCPRSFVIAQFEQVMKPHQIDFWHLMFDYSELFSTWRDTLGAFMQRPNELVREICKLISRSFEYDKRLDQWFADLPDAFKVSHELFDMQKVPRWFSEMMEISQWKPRWLIFCSDLTTEQYWRELTSFRLIARHALFASVEHLESKEFGLHHPMVSSVLGDLTKDDLSRALALSVQESWEAAISILIRPISSKSETGQGNICGLRSGLAFGPFIFCHMCVLQNPWLKGLLPGCLEWNQRFLRLNVEMFGYAKVTAYQEVKPEQFDPLRLQVWSLAFEVEDRG
jgi:hypothetical protein